MSPLKKLMFSVGPYKNFSSDKKTDITGWNSTKPIFKEMIKLNKPKIIIEVGSWKGASAIHMAGIIKELKLDTKIICIDTWLGSDEHWYYLDRLEHSDLRLNHGYPQLYYTFLNNIIKSGHSDIIIPLAQTSTNAYKILKHFGIKAEVIYIDGSHNEIDVYNDISNYSELLTGKKCMFGDDYNLLGVNNAVTRYATKYKKTSYGKLFWSITG